MYKLDQAMAHIEWLESGDHAARLRALQELGMTIGLEPSEEAVAEAAKGALNTMWMAGVSSAHTIIVTNTFINYIQQRNIGGS